MQTRISERAVTKIVAAATLSVPGTISTSSGMDRITGRSFPRFDVQLDHDADTATVEAFIAVSWPSPLLDVAETVRATIIDHMWTLAGIEVLVCNVVVGPVLASSRGVAADDVQVQPLTPLPIPEPKPVPLRPIYVRGQR